MYTLEEYLKYYGNLDLDSQRWNTQDNLICSLLSYLTVDNFNEEKNLKQFYEFVRNKEEIVINDYTCRNSYSILKKLMECPRYKDMRFINSKRILDNTAMFGALTIKINDLTIVSFKGSDHSSIAWKENFRLFYQYPTYTQTLAIDYLNNVMGDKIYVNGHSKGGNLAIVSSMEVKEEIFDKIISIDNFDGPGLRLEEFNSTKYQRVLPKLINYLPTNSYIGSLFYNQNYKYIKTNTIGVSIHYPFNWSLFGTMFIDGKSTSFSERINMMSTQNYNKIDQIRYREIMENILSEIPEDENGMLKLNLKELKRIINNIQEVDEQTKDYIFSMFSTIFTGVIR